MDARQKIFSGALGGGPKPPFLERLAKGRRPLKKTSNGADRQTNRQTETNCDLETESAKWADSVKMAYNMIEYGGRVSQLNRL